VPVNDVKYLHAVGLARFETPTHFDVAADAH